MIHSVPSTLLYVHVVSRQRNVRMCLLVNIQWVLYIICLHVCCATLSNKMHTCTISMVTTEHSVHGLLYECSFMQIIIYICTCTYMYLHMYFVYVHACVIHVGSRTILSEANIERV